jgi:HAD superfamily hydrolase (TIGR01509 family)
VIKAVFFDFDGLILDTETPEVVAWREMFADYGLEFPDWCWQEMIGQCTPDSGSLPLRVLRDELGKPIDMDALMEQSRVRRHELLAAERILPGIQAALEQAPALGLRCAVVSSSKRPWVEGHLERLGLLHYFEHVVCGGEEHPSKPDPALYRAALQKMGVSGSEALALEDSPRGVQAAKAAGMFCVAIPNGLTQLLDLSQADLVVENFAGAALEDLIRSLSAA